MKSASRSDQFVEHVVASQRRIYAYILTLLPDPNEASDVLQQTNMALWRDADRFVEGTNFIAWAFRTAYYMVLEHREKLHRTRLRFSDVLVEQLAKESAAYSEEEDLRLAAMRQCMQELRQDQQDLINRRYGQGEMVRSIAASLGQTANGLANNLYRIRQALWNCIQRRLSPEGNQ